MTLFGGVKRGRAAGIWELTRIEMMHRPRVGTSKALVSGAVGDTKRRDGWAVSVLAHALDRTRAIVKSASRGQLTKHTKVLAHCCQQRSLYAVGNLCQLLAVPIGKVAQETLSSDFPRG